VSWWPAKQTEPDWVIDQDPDGAWDYLAGFVVGDAIDQWTLTKAIVLALLDVKDRRDE
jgi:hypothetical protein